MGRADRRRGEHGRDEIRFRGRRRVDLDPDPRSLDDEVGRARGSRVQSLGDGIRKEADRVGLPAREARRRPFPSRGRRRLRRRVLPLEAAALFAPEALEVRVTLRDLVAARGRIDRETPVLFDEPAPASSARPSAPRSRPEGRSGRAAGAPRARPPRSPRVRGRRRHRIRRGSRGRSHRPCPRTSSRRTQTPPPRTSRETERAPGCRRWLGGSFDRWAASHPAGTAVLSEALWTSMPRARATAVKRSSTASDARASDTRRAMRRGPGKNPRRRPEGRGPRRSERGAVLEVDPLPHDRPGHDRRGGRSRELPAGKRRAAAPGQEALRIHFPSGVGVEEGHVRGRARREGSARQAERLRRTRREERREALERELAARDQPVVDDRGRGLEADDAERRAVEISAFSSAWWGAWSEAIASIVPSTSPATSASRSAPSRSGGFILQCGREVRTAPTSSSVSRRWCGVTSQVTREAARPSPSHHLEARAVERCAT